MITSRSLQDNRSGMEQRLKYRKPRNMSICKLELTEYEVSSTTFPRPPCLEKPESKLKHPRQKYFAFALLRPAQPCPRITPAYPSPKRHYDEQPPPPLPPPPNNRSPWPAKSPKVPKGPHSALSPCPSAKRTLNSILHDSRVSSINSTLNLQWTLGLTLRRAITPNRPSKATALDLNSKASCATT
jgi:hypothetical protein